MTNTVLAVKNLTKIYDGRRGKKTIAVDDISFSIRKNEVVGLLGPNGAGKTTTIKCICTLINPTKGTINVNGTDAVKNSRTVLQKVTAVLEGNRNIYWRLSVRENLEFFAGLQGIPARRVQNYIDQLIELFQLKEKEQTPARKLSRGMQQKLAVACALVKQTDILLLDEPTLGLDVEISHELRFALKEMAQRGERTIIVSSHDMSVVQDICERVIIINNGRIVTDDRVANLLRLFEASAYRFEIEGRLAEQQVRRLEERFEILKVSGTDYHTEIEVDLEDGNQIYEIMDILKEGDSRIRSIARKDPNMEEIFLSIIKGGKQ
ncbi:ABC transporter ATP-binding protein [Candidatus Acetothermia bacterium]|nr:ABC transporter ATP-binding protein [Candidatus Acetothermia bacterium]